MGERVLERGGPVSETPRALEKLNIRRPTLVLDRARAVRNIERMAARASSAGVALRPHFKTHQSLGVGRWFRDVGVSAITVSSVAMAHYFAGDGWTDITVAFPVNLRELDDIAALAERVRLGVLVDSRDAAQAVARRMGTPLRVWLKIDTGYGRAGVAWDDGTRIAAVADDILGAASLEFAGILSYNGLTYRERTPEGVRRVHDEALEKLRSVRELLVSRGGVACAVSIGDTPGASLAEDFAGVDELRPGNFVFYDLTQVGTGSCAPDDIAAAVACPVVGIYPERGRVLLYGGAVHLSAESMKGEDGRVIFGQASRAWPGGAGPFAPVVSVFQEHGVLEADAQWAAGLRLGDLVCVLPVHSCMACNLYTEYVTLDGERLGTIHRGAEDPTGRSLMGREAHDGG